VESILADAPPRARDLPAFVAFRGSEPAGLAVYDLRPGESCEIVLLHTAGERIGLGSALLRECKRVARRARCLFLWVRPEPDPTRPLRFYERNGFRADGDTGQLRLDLLEHGDTAAL
jgi:GNAT superfamily N-acetyltransferase